MSGWCRWRVVTRPTQARRVACDPGHGNLSRDARGSHKLGTTNGANRSGQTEAPDMRNGTLAMFEAATNHATSAFSEEQGARITNQRGQTYPTPNESAFGYLATVPLTRGLRRRRRPWAARVARFAGIIGMLPLFVAAGGQMMPTVVFGGLAVWPTDWPTTGRAGLSPGDVAVLLNLSPGTRGP